MAPPAIESLGVESDWNRLYIDGEWTTPDERETIPVTNPATSETLTDVVAATASDVDRAYRAASEAQSEWANQPPQARAEVLQRAIGLLREFEDDLIEISVAEAGSTPLKAGLETEAAQGVLSESASFPTRMKGEQADSVVPGKENLVVREPVGTVGVITPWNFPFILSMRAVAPAIALGNAVVLKPDEHTPISGGLAIAKLFDAAGLPDGVLNVVTGHGEEAGAALAGHGEADAVSFTGSTEVGKTVAQNAASNLAHLSLELGGNNPHVVLEGADLDAAVDAGAFGSFIHQGQVCISINRHLVHESLYDEYVDRLADRAASLSVGNPADPDNDLGPIINDEQVSEMVGYIDEAVDAGATVETGGEHEGRFVEPTVLSGVTNDMAVACNEHFGPIAPVVPVADEAEAIELANDTPYGLAASVHGRLERARRVADAIDAGMVHIGDQPLNDEPHIPFGGVKDSGLGRFNGESILDELTEQKWISIQHDRREYPL